MPKRIVITQGEHFATADPETTISTLLGSCVACCLWDPLAEVGGMNHILLASGAGASANGPSLGGINAMELLINDLLKLGARRNRLIAKAFGGAQMVSGLSSIGPDNARFALDYLRRENIVCASQSLGGDMARQVVFTPTSGAVRVKVQQREAPEANLADLQQSGNGLELL